MMNQEQWLSSITSIQPNQVRLRGYLIDELMGEVSFSDAIYLALMGEMPSNEVSQLVGAILVASIDHGATPPSALAARTAASTGAPLNAAVACGLLSINRYHGGAIEGCMKMLEQALMSEEAIESNELQRLAQATIRSFQEDKRRVPGLGHRLHTNDPRTEKLFALADELGLSGYGVRLLVAIRKALEEEGKSLPINVDGAIAAILVDLKIPSPLANAFFFMARIPGLVAHVYEEQTTQKPMRRIHPSAHTYDGPPPRSIKQ